MLDGCNNEDRADRVRGQFDDNTSGLLHGEGHRNRTAANGVGHAATYERCDRFRPTMVAAMTSAAPMMVSRTARSSGGRYSKPSR